MSRYIDADKLKESMCNQCRSHCKGEDDWCAAIYDVMDAPTEDVAEVKRGKWIADDDGIVICSECGEEHDWDDFRPPYCDMCGAKMGGDEK